MQACALVSLGNMREAVSCFECEFLEDFHEYYEQALNDVWSLSVISAGYETAAMVPGLAFQVQSD